VGCYYIIIYYILYIISYTTIIYCYYYILLYYTYYTILFLFSSSSSSHLFFYLLLSSSVLFIYPLFFLFLPNPLIHSILPLLIPPIFKVYLSVLTYTYLYSIYLISSHLPNHSILVGTRIRLFIFFKPTHLNHLTPHVLSEWMVEVWCVYKYVVLDYILLLLYIIYYTYTIIIHYIIHTLYYILYIILYSSVLLFLPNYLFPSWSLPSHLFPPSPSNLFFPSSPLLNHPPLFIQSILVGTYIYLFIFNQYSHLPQPNNSTPHVLSEWMSRVV